MACKDCKKKKLETEKIKNPSKSPIKIDRAVTWIIIVWFLLGGYGLWSLIEKIFHL